MSSISKAGSRLGKTKVRFDLKAKVKQVYLPGVANGAKVFVILERGKAHKSWTKPHGYVSSQISSSKEYVDKWASENLHVPITLYRGKQGMYQPKAFKIKIMKDPSAKTGDFPVSENPVLASFTLDATKFRVMSDSDSPGTIRAQASPGKGCVKGATILLSIACVFNHDSTGDAQSVGSSSRASGFSKNSGVSSINLNDESDFEQDLSGFGEIDETPTTSSGRKWGWWSNKKENSMHASDFSSDHKQMLAGVAECRESLEANHEVKSTDRSTGSLSGKSMVGKFMSKSLTSRDSAASKVSSDLKMAQRAEKEANSSQVAELLRSLGLGMYIKPIVMQLGFDDYEVLRSLRAEEFVELVNDAGMKPGHATKLRLRLGISRPRNPQAEDDASRTECEQLVGKWIEVRGIGIGKIVGFHRVWNHLMNHSCHVVDFSVAGKNLPTSSLMEISRQRHDSANSLKEVHLLLRRRKLGRWNRGCFFEIVPDPH